MLTDIRKFFPNKLIAKLDARLKPQLLIVDFVLKSIGQLY